MIYLLPSTDSISSDDLSHLFLLLHIGERLEHELQGGDLQRQLLMQMLKFEFFSPFLGFWNFLLIFNSVKLASGDRKKS